MFKIFSQVLLKILPPEKNWEKLNVYFWGNGRIFFTNIPGLNDTWNVLWRYLIWPTYFFVTLGLSCSNLLYKKNPSGNCPQTTANIFISRSSDFHEIWTILWPKLLKEITLIILHTILFWSRTRFLSFSRNQKKIL